MELSPKVFFSTISFIELFSGCELAWEPLLKLKEFFSKNKLGKIEVKIPSTVHLESPELISIGEGTIVEPGAYIKGPCIIGKNCVIRHGAYIREHVLTGDNVTIGHDTEVKHSILMEGATASHFAYIGDSIVGRDVNLGAGVKCANFRLDRGLVFVHYQGKKLQTGLKKFGAIIGDGVQIGCNSVLNPGTLIGKNSICYPLVNVQGFLPPNTKYKGNQ
ncbi:MAG TPA: LpxA family transferase [Chlamydiales bacterium]|nr:LpxA family transferase [Chlamydiales bacterium]